MKDWLNRRALAALVAGLVAGGAVASGVGAFAADGPAVPAQAPLSCSTSTVLGADGDGITFGAHRPWAV